MKVLIATGELYQTASSPTRLKRNIQCSFDYDCDAGHYCYESNLCAKCTDCYVYNRLPGEKLCAHSAQECGRCLDGYGLVTLTGNRIQEFCRKSSITTTPSPTKDNYRDLSLYGLIAAAIIIFIGIVFCCARKSFISWFKQRVVLGPFVPTENSTNKNPKEDLHREEVREEEVIPLQPSAPILSALDQEVKNETETSDLLQARCFRRSDTPPPPYNSTHSGRTRVPPISFSAEDAMPSSDDQTAMINTRSNEFNRLNGPHNESGSDSDTSRPSASEDGTARNRAPFDSYYPSNENYGSTPYRDSSHPFSKLEIVINNQQITQNPVSNFNHLNN